VVGYEELVTVQAGQRVALSAGARLVHVAAGRLDRAGVAALRSAKPDIVLLVGGTDGGDEDVLRHNASALATVKRTPVVVAGNASLRAQVLAALGDRAVGTDNVLPRIGELNPGPARSAIREAFLQHVIGGKHLSRRPRFARLVRGATPDIVLSAVELLASVVGDVLVVDVGGATTDVYSTIEPPAGTVRSTDVAGTAWHGRTVEGDLGVRSSAPGIVDAALAERLIRADEAERLAPLAMARADRPALLPTAQDEVRVDLRLAELAATIAVRRHARGRDLRRVRLVVGSGGVLRHRPAAGEAVLGALLADHAGGWAPPEGAHIAIDSSYLLAPIGLLVGSYPRVAQTLVRSLCGTRPPDTPRHDVSSAWRIDTFG
jgi:uncharacterized protein (TIGR01319 family)